MATDILYVAFNRLDFTKASFDALLTNTDWVQVDTLYVLDDRSTDGTADWLQEQEHRLPATTSWVFHGSKFGGPVAAMIWYLQHCDYERSDRFVKIDNDFVVCPGWLEELQRLAYLNPRIDIFGMEPMMGPPKPCPFEHRTIEEARFIGGKGLIRHRAFDRCYPRPSGRNGYQGFTQWQVEHPAVLKAWAKPDLPCFGLDQLPIQEWRDLTTTYTEYGWQRRWGEYDRHATAYWNWWLETQVPA